MSGRLSSFFLGAAAGSAYYYGVTYSMLHNVSKADKRIVEIREELVGMATAPVHKARNFALSAIMTPLQPYQDTWNSYIKKGKAAVSDLFSKASLPTPSSPSPAVKEQIKEQVAIVTDKSAD